jgi:hypothetical protein
MLITYTCIWTAVKSYDMTGTSVYMDESERRAVYTAPGRVYNALRIVQICQMATEILYVDCLFLCMNNRKII